MAEQKASSPKVKRLARKIIMEQQKDIARMRTYLTRWYSNPTTAKADPRMHDTMQKIGVLSGAAFDRAFLREMTNHHNVRHSDVPDHRGPCSARDPSAVCIAYHLFARPRGNVHASAFAESVTPSHIATHVHGVVRKGMCEECAHSGVN
jgi:hypothetical protein